MILVRVRNNDGVQLDIPERLEVRQRFFPFEPRVHAAIEHQPMPVDLEIVAISPDLGPTRQVDEFHCNQNGRRPLYITKGNHHPQPHPNQQV